MEFTDKEKEYIIKAVDCYVRTNGVNAASFALVVITKLQTPNVIAPAQDEKEKKDKNKDT